MEHLEDTLSFQARRLHAKTYGLSGSGFQDWFVAFFQQMRGYPTVFDYATRIALSNKLLEHMNPSFKKACKIALEKILFNLAANPDQVVLAVKPGEGSVSGRNLRPLNDDIFTTNGSPLVQERYQLLTRVLTMYCEIGLEDIENDLQEIDLSSYREWFERAVPLIPPLQEQLASGRKELYCDFPPDLLTSVEEGVILASHKTYKKVDAVCKSKRGRILESEILSLQDQLLRSLREIISRAKAEIEIQEERASTYLSIVSNIKVMKHMLEVNISPAEALQVEKQIVDFEEKIRDFFAPKNFIPADLLSDLFLQHSMYKNGNP